MIKNLLALNVLKNFISEKGKAFVIELFPNSDEMCCKIAANVISYVTTLQLSRCSSILCYAPSLEVEQLQSRCTFYD